MDNGDLDVRIAQRIKARRSELRLSLDGLSEISGVSRAMISRIERAESSATAVLLAKLCNALGMTLSGLMADAERPPHAIARRDAQRAWRDVETGYVRRLVSPPGTGSAIELVEVELSPGVRVDFDTPPAIPYEQHLVIVDGRLSLTMGAERLELHTGDCIFMIVNSGVTFENRTAERVRYLVALTSDPALSTTIALEPNRRTISVKDIAFTAYPSNDVTATRRWYEEKLGLQFAGPYIERNIEKYNEARVGRGCFSLMSAEWTSRPPGSASSVYFEVDDVDITVAWLQENGVTIDDRFEGPVCKQASFCDPEGNKVTIHESTTRV